MSTHKTGVRIWDMHLRSPEVAANFKHTFTDPKEIKCNFSNEQQKTTTHAKQNIVLNLHYLSKPSLDAADKS